MNTIELLAIFGEIHLDACIGITISVLAVIVAFVLWCLFGRVKQTVDPVNFYPPENTNSLEARYYYKGKIDDKGIISLLMYLISKGYIRIEPGKGRDFTLYLLNDYDGENRDERIFLNTIFSDNTIVTKTALRKKLYYAVDAIKESYRFKVKDIFAKHTLISKIAIALMVVVVLTINTILYGTSNGGNPTLGAMAVIIFFVNIIELPLYVILAIQRMPRLDKVILTSFYGVIYIGPIINSSLDSYRLYLKGEIDFIYIAMMVIMAISIISQIAIFTIMLQRSEYGDSMKTRINGFRTFLETAEKSQLEVLVTQNPHYFYDILPYTYALDVSEKWVDRFNNIATPPVDWGG